jgi:hypothetical protein
MGRLGTDPHVLERILHHSRKSLGLKGVYNQFDYFKERKVALDKWGAHVEALVIKSAAQAAA